MARFLIASVPVTGHVNPGLPIVRALVERGHEVWWYTGQKFRARVEATGARYVPMQAAYDYDDSDTNAAFPGRAGRSGLAALKWDLKHLFYDLLPGQVIDLRRILRAFPADVLLADTGFLGAGALHELGGPPYAVYGITALPLSSRDTAPFGLGLPPDSSTFGRMRNRALSALFQHVIFHDVAAHANGVRDTLGLPPLQRSVVDVRSPFLYLQSSTPAFEYPRGDLEPQVHFIGPLLPETSSDFAPPPMYPFKIYTFVGERPLVAAASTGHVGAAPAYLDTRFLAMQPKYETMLRGVGIQLGWRVLEAGCGGIVAVKEIDGRCFRSGQYQLFRRFCDNDSPRNCLDDRHSDRRARIAPARPSRRPNGGDYRFRQRPALSSGDQR